jgi:hypothetical protein
MKYYIVLLLVLMTVSSKAQITLEHTYSNQDKKGIPAREFGLIEVDSEIYKYIDYNKKDSIYIYNLDHSLDRIIHVPFDTSVSYPHICQISKRLFDPDDAYEYLFSGRNPQYFLKVIKENGDILFACNTCDLSTSQNYLNDASQVPASIISTPNGVKMLVEFYGNPLFVAVYRLPGKLPGGSAKSTVNAPTIVSGNSFPVSAYPNPSNGQMRISYKLPLGESTGDLVILTTDGVEVKRYKVGYGFNDILVEKSDLPSGSYFYELVTEKGESEMKNLIILK